jgi:hypothetical protein
LFADSTGKEEELDQRGVRLKSAENVKASARICGGFISSPATHFAGLIASVVDWILGYF